MFCSSLRKRAEWATVPQLLLSGPKWKELDLKTYDIAVPIPRPQEKGNIDFFRLIALSSVDLQDLVASMGRVERFYNQTGGKDVGIVFLLQETTPKGSGITDYMNLQISLLQDYEMPILPVHSLSSLQKTLSTFQRDLYIKRYSTSQKSINPAVSLLPYCSSTTISEHSANVLRGFCHSIPQLAEIATTDSGRNQLRDWLSHTDPQAAENVIDFWEQELLAE